MKDQLYIPKEIRVGFQERKDTFTGKLAYVIYVDGKGVLRKEASWNSWRDQKIEPLSFNNEPTSGFMINKNIARYNWSHFSSNRSYIRIHDPRGFEFEVTPENLIGILMSGNCNHRVLDGEFVYSWSGTELVLLPVNTDAYQNSLKFTKLQTEKISTKNLVPGLVYRNKRQEDYVYLGRFMWYTYDWNRKTQGYERIGRKSFIFMEEEELSEARNNFHVVTSLSSFAEKVSDVPSANYAAMMDRLNLTENISARMEGIVKMPIDVAKLGDAREIGWIDLGDGLYENVIAEYGNNRSFKQKVNRNSDKKINLVFYKYKLEGHVMTPVSETKYRKSYWGRSDEPYFEHIKRDERLSYEEIENLNLFAIKFKLENGKESRLGHLTAHFESQYRMYDAELGAFF